MMSGLAAGVLGGKFGWVKNVSEVKLLLLILEVLRQTFLLKDGKCSETDSIDLYCRFPLLMPMLDIHTIGFGGGSIAYLDKGGAF